MPSYQETLTAYCEQRKLSKDSLHEIYFTLRDASHLLTPQQIIEGCIIIQRDPPFDKEDVNYRLAFSLLEAMSKSEATKLGCDVVLQIKKAFQELDRNVFPSGSFKHYTMCAVSCAIEKFLKLPEASAHLSEKERLELAGIVLRHAYTSEDYKPGNRTIAAQKQFAVEAKAYSDYVYRVWLTAHTLTELENMTQIGFGSRPDEKFLAANAAQAIRILEAERRPADRLWKAVAAAGGVVDSVTRRVWPNYTTLRDAIKHRPATGDVASHEA